MLDVETIGPPHNHVDYYYHYYYYYYYYYNSYVVVVGRWGGVFGIRCEELVGLVLYGRPAAEEEEEEKEMTGRGRALD